jgi:hypothetical protein
MVQLQISMTFEDDQVLFGHLVIWYSGSNILHKSYTSHIVSRNYETHIVSWNYETIQEI